MIVIIFFAVLCIVLFIMLLVGSELYTESSKRKAGRDGEEYATQIIRQAMNEKDILLTNISVSYGDNKTELDEVIVNSRGVFIVEVKNYSGTLYGTIEDFEWCKRKTSRGGNCYEKIVRNPIKQVNRQVYILSNYLRTQGVQVWVEGYVFFVNDNSPVQDKSVLRTHDDIDSAIHGKVNNHLSRAVMKKIIECIETE